MITPGEEPPRSDRATPAGDVAVVIACFNDGATIGEAVASAVAERPAEVVVVDDGSDDPKTLVALEGLPEGVRLVRQRNAGPAAARSAGVAASSAPFVLALDADDTLCPGALDALAGALARDPDAALAWGDAWLVGTVSGRQPTPGALDPWRITFRNEIHAAALVRRSPSSGWGGGAGAPDTRTGAFGWRSRTSARAA